jgi:hypothetical protein
LDVKHDSLETKGVMSEIRDPKVHVSADGVTTPTKFDIRAHLITPLPRDISSLVKPKGGEGAKAETTI